MSRFLLGLLIFAAAQAQDRAPFYFLQFSDPQLGMFAKDADMVQDAANFEFAIASANRLRPAFVVVCGDLINKAGDPAQIREYHKLTGKLDRSIPIYNIAGNHDVGNEPTPESLARYREQFGRDYYTFDVRGMRGIVLNSSLIGSPQKAAEEPAKQEAWLKGELERARAAKVQRVMIFQHIPYFLERADEPDQYFNIPHETRARYLELLHRYGVTYVFAGHTHRNWYARDGDLQMIATGPVGMPIGPDQSGLRVVIVNSAAVSHRYYELGSIPHEIDPAQPLPDNSHR